MSMNNYIAKQFAKPKGLGGTIVSLIMNRQNRPLYDETIRMLAVSDFDSILDIGCGNGFVLNLIARQSNAALMGIDPSVEIIEAAMRRNRKLVKSEQMNFSCQNTESTSFSDASFTKAYSINTVYFWNDLSAPMREIKRILKPGGIFINTLYSNETLDRFSHTKFGYRRYDTEQLTRAGISQGFEVQMVPILKKTAICCIYTKQKDG